MNVIRHMFGYPFGFGYLIYPKLLPVWVWVFCYFGSYFGSGFSESGKMPRPRGKPWGWSDGLISLHWRFLLSILGYRVHARAGPKSRLLILVSFLCFRLIWEAFFSSSAACILKEAVFGCFIVLPCWIRFKLWYCTFLSNGWCILANRSFLIASFITV